MTCSKFWNELLFHFQEFYMTDGQTEQGAESTIKSGFSCKDLVMNVDLARLLFNALIIFVPKKLTILYPDIEMYLVLKLGQKWK